jgi:hypothetical protein
MVFLLLSTSRTHHMPNACIMAFNAFIFLRMVDDFSIGCKLEETYTKLCEILDNNWQVPMSRYGMMKHFNGIGVYQSRTHVSISRKTYMDTVFKNYGWKDLTPTSLPMNPSNEFV